MLEAVADTGPPLHLAEAGQIRHLRMFDIVTMPSGVEAELKKKGVLPQVKKALGKKLKVEGVAESAVADVSRRLSAFRLQDADLQVAALATVSSSSAVLTDDLQLRKALEQSGHLVVGSIGILIRSYRDGKLTRVALERGLSRIFDDSSLYLSRAFKRHVLSLLDQLTK